MVFQSPKTLVLCTFAIATHYSSTTIIPIIIYICRTSCLGYKIKAHDHNVWSSQSYKYCLPTTTCALVVLVAQGKSSLNQERMPQVVLSSMNEQYHN